MLKNMTLPEIPQSALQRKQLLNEILGSTGKAPRWSPLLNEFKNIMASDSFEGSAVLLDQIEKEGLLEECSDLLRNSPHSLVLKSARNHLDARLILYRRKRAIHPEEEATYRYRLSYEKGRRVAILGVPELQRIFLCALQSEGVLIKYDFSKHPKPMIELAPILSPNTTGSNEFIELHCRQELPFPEKESLERLNQRLPGGLIINSCDRIPTFASSIYELATHAHWSWPIDESLISKESIMNRIKDFATSSKLMLSSMQGKESTCDLKVLVHDLMITGEALVWSTTFTDVHSPNPLRAIAQVLNIESSQIEGLKRTSLTLSEDLRLKQSDKFSRKLKNIYEDATILDGDSSITVHNDDDDYISLG